MLLLTGLNHHTTPIEIREQCYIETEQLPSLLLQIKQLAGIEETVVISTCNRLEVYTVAQNATSISAITRVICGYYGLNDELIGSHLHIEQDQRAVSHLMRVASSLDSMVLGEAQILGQVRNALSAAVTAGTAGTLLHRLFERAMHAGKRAHAETLIGEHTTSISHAAARLVIDHAPAPDADVLIVGIGEMGALAAQALTDRGYHNIHIVNRTYNHACDLAERIGATAHEWSFVWDRLVEADVVISATGAPHMVLYQQDMRHVVTRRDHKPLVLVDIAVPRDIDPHINTLPNTRVYDIDTMQGVVDDNVAQRLEAVPQVEEIVAEETAKYVAWLQERSVTPVICQLREEVQAVVQDELADALNKLQSLSERDQAVVQRMAHRILNKVLHAPTVGLRAHAANGDGDEYAQVIRELFDLMPDVR